MLEKDLRTLVSVGILQLKCNELVFGVIADLRWI
jgi:hypothetical protein